jgi:hypothetical protein
LNVQSKHGGLGVVDIEISEKLIADECGLLEMPPWWRRRAEDRSISEI